jgi:hypothetical protein
MPVRRSVLAAAVAALALPICAAAQYPADNQVGQVDNRVGGEIYGNEGGKQDRRNGNHQTRLLPSEERDARIRSGMLPSEYDLNRAQFGPLTPNGELDYITRQSPLQQAMRLPQGRLINPAYDPDRRRLQRFGLPPAIGGYPQNAREGVFATTRKPGATTANPMNQQARRPGELANPLPPQNQPRDLMLPALTPAPDAPLPDNRLPDDLKYNPDATPGAQMLRQNPLQQKPQPQPTKPTPKPPSLSDEQQPPPQAPQLQPQPEQPRQ